MAVGDRRARGGKRQRTHEHLKHGGERCCRWPDLLPVSHEPSASLHRRRRPRTIDACAQSSRHARYRPAPRRRLAPTVLAAGRPCLAACCQATALAVRAAGRGRTLACCSPSPPVSPMPQPRLSHSQGEGVEMEEVGPTRLAWEDFSLLSSLSSMQSGEKIL